ncbi:AmmeMemoRadiSam system protein A [Chloroflexota bacterium]
MADPHPLVELARRTIEIYLETGRRIDPPGMLADEMQRRAAVFVTIRRHGELCGCIGTLEPVHDSLAEEVIHNAISAATRDPRFPPLRSDELPDVEIKVDVLTEPVPISSQDELDPKRYGLIVRSADRPWKRGVLLPDLQGIDTVEKQVHWTRYHKAGITDPEEPVEMFRFEVERLS